MSLIEGIDVNEIQEDLVRLQRSLEHSQSRAKLGSWEFDPVRQKGWWSSGMHVLFDHDSSQGLPTLDEFLELVHPDDRDRIVANQRELTTPGQTRTIQFRSNPDLGPVRSFVEIVDCLIRDGRPILAGTTQDVTDRRLASERLANRSRQQAAVAQLGLAALQDTSIDRLMQEAVELVAEILDVPYSKILELAGTGTDLLLRWGVGWQDRLIGETLVPAEQNSQAGFTLRCEEPVVVESLPEETRFQGSQLLLEHGVISGISVVINSAEKPFGVLAVHTRQKRIFEQDEVNFLQSVANVLAGAIRHRNADETLRESERSLAKAQQIARTGNWEFDLLSGQLSGSAEIFRIVGLSPDAATPSFESFIEQQIHSDDRQLLIRSYRDGMKTGWPRPLEFRLLRLSDNQLRYVRADAELVADASGRPLKIIGTLRDITQRKQVELALRESEEKFRVLTERSPAIVLIARAGKIVYGNPMLSVATGYSTEELQQMSFLQIVHRDDREFVAEQHRRRLAGEESARRYEIKIVTRHDQERWIDVSAQLIDFEGTRAVLVTCVDITERKMAEQQIWEMDAQLAHVSRLSMMGEMVAGIAHEINQPLSAIANYAAACKNTIKATDYQYEAPIETWLHAINQQAVQCGDIIRRLRTFVKKGDNRRSFVDLNLAVTDSIALISSDLRQQPVVNCRLPDVAPIVRANHVQIQQVLVNLLKNACDATIDKADPRVIVTVRQQDASACIIVEDNGTGIEESERCKLFNAFYTTKPNGMGMGLAISKSIMEVLEGNLIFEPAEPSGARFLVQLPINQAGEDTP